MLNYRFYILCDINGEQEPIIKFGTNAHFVHLESLVRGHMSESSGVRQELNNIVDVLNGKKEIHSFGGDDWCIVDFKRGKSTILNGFDEFEPFDIDSSDILALLQDWYHFLLIYESGGIPGITRR